MGSPILFRVRAEGSAFFDLPEISTKKPIQKSVKRLSSPEKSLEKRILQRIGELVRKNPRSGYRSITARLRLEKLLNRELSAEEKERLRRIQDTLQISADDCLWDVLAAMEYQKAYYEEMPQKIATASTEVLRGISDAAEAESRRAQGRLAENMAELAQKLAVRINMATLLPMGLAALVSLPAYGSLMLWAGFCLGSGRVHPPELLLRMPSGIVMGGLCLAGGVFLGIHAAKDFSEGRSGWQKRMIVALVMLVPGGIVFSLAL
jgi:hypothetical protein